MTTNRFIVVHGSMSGTHDIFTHSVVDSTDPLSTNPDSEEYYCMCECYDLESADLIAMALNQLSGSEYPVQISNGPDDFDSDEAGRAALHNELKDLFQAYPLQVLDALWFGIS